MTSQFPFSRATKLFSYLFLLLGLSSCGIRDLTGHDDDPFFHAVRKGDARVVNLLIKEGEDVNKINTYDDGTALHIATTYGQKEIVKILIDADANVKAVDEDGNSALFYAESTEVAKILIEAGANVKLKNKNEETALFYVEKKEMAEFFVEKGLSLTAVNKQKRTPLILAAKNGHVEVAKFLIEKDADLEAEDENEETALMHAATSFSSYSLDMVKLLVDNGANVKAKNKSGKTALDLAKEREDKDDVVEFLEGK